MEVKAATNSVADINPDLIAHFADQRDTWKQWASVIAQENCSLRDGAKRRFAKMFLDSRGLETCVESVLSEPLSDEHAEGFHFLIRKALCDDVGRGNEPDVVDNICARLQMISKVFHQNRELQQRYTEGYAGATAEKDQMDAWMSTTVDAVVNSVASLRRHFDDASSPSDEFAWNTLSTSSGSKQQRSASSGSLNAADNDGRHSPTSRQTSEKAHRAVQQSMHALAKLSDKLSQYSQKKMDDSEVRQVAEEQKQQLDVVANEVGHAMQKNCRSTLSCECELEKLNIAHQEEEADVALRILENEEMLACVSGEMKLIEERMRKLSKLSQSIRRNLGILRGRRKSVSEGKPNEHLQGAIEERKRCRVFEQCLCKQQWSTEVASTFISGFKKAIAHHAAVALQQHETSLNAAIVRAAESAACCLQCLRSVIFELLDGHSKLSSVCALPQMSQASSSQSPAIQQLALFIAMQLHDIENDIKSEMNTATETAEKLNGLCESWLYERQPNSEDRDRVIGLRESVKRSFNELCERVDPISAAIRPHGKEGGGTAVLGVHSPTKALSDGSQTPPPPRTSSAATLPLKFRKARFPVSSSPGVDASTIQRGDTAAASSNTFDFERSLTAINVPQEEAHSLNNFIVKFRAMRNLG